MKTFTSTLISSVVVFGLLSSPLMAQTVLMQKQGTEFAIDGNRGSTQERQQVYMWNTSLDNVNQQWVEIDRGNGFYSYQKKDTSLCLDGGNGGENFQPVILFSCGETNYNQHWRKLSAGGNSYRLEKRNAPTFAIDGNYGADDGQVIYLFDSNERNVNQQWEFLSARTATATVVMQKQGTAFAIDGNNGTSQESEQVYVWNTNTGNVNQQWVEIDRGNGFYSYQKQNTSLCLDGGNGGENLQPVILFGCGDTNYNQHWRKVSTGGNSYRLEKRNAPAFSIDGNRGAERSQGIYLYGSNSSNVNQQWEFLSASTQTVERRPTNDNNSGTVSSSSGLIHPGGWHSQADLTLIREKVAAGQEPWISAWNEIRNDSPRANYTTNPSRLVTGNGEMHTAGFNAWILTMKWVASGDKSYADAAIGIIDKWVDTVRDFDVYGPTLTVSTGAGAMAQAAEVLEHGFNGEAGWSAAKADAAKVWFKEIIYDRWTNTGDQRSSNWGTSALGGNMSMSIFMDIREEFEYQRDAYLFGYRDTDDGCASINDYVMYDSGQAFETGRDQAHVQGGIAHLTEAALSAWNQGVNLVGASNNRIRAGVEYHAKYNLGYDDVPFNHHIPNPCGIWNPGQDEGVSDDERGIFSPVYYMSSKLFTEAGLDHPYTKEVLRSPGYSPEATNFAHPGLGTLVFNTDD